MWLKNPFIGGTIVGSGYLGDCNLCFAYESLFERGDLVGVGDFDTGDYILLEMPYYLFSFFNPAKCFKSNVTCGAIIFYLTALSIALL